MKYFTCAADAEDVNALIKEALQIKNQPLSNAHLGMGKTLGLIFLNPSLRTRFSTQVAAQNLGMQVITMNIEKEGWTLEFKDGSVMDGNASEHIKDAAGAMSQYCDILGIRCFPGLKNKEDDYEEKILSQFLKYCTVPVISLESATRHPLQSLADVMTIAEHRGSKRPKVVLTWAPHIKPLPQAVANSFSEWMSFTDAEFVIAHPEGYELAVSFCGKATLCYNQEEALEGADFVYVKNWSSFHDYGKMPAVRGNWLLNPEKMKRTADAHWMHCLPVRRNLEMPDFCIDHPKSLIQKQAFNRIFSAQVVLEKLLLHKMKAYGREANSFTCHE